MDFIASCGVNISIFRPPCRKKSCAIQEKHLFYSCGCYTHFAREFFFSSCTIYYFNFILFAKILIIYLFDSINHKKSDSLCNALNIFEKLKKQLLCSPKELQCLVDFKITYKLKLPEYRNRRVSTYVFLEDFRGNFLRMSQANDR